MKQQHGLSKVKVNVSQEQKLFTLHFACQRALEPVYKLLQTILPSLWMVLCSEVASSQCSQLQHHL